MGQLVIHNKLETEESQLPCMGLQNVCERVNGNVYAYLRVCMCVSVDQRPSVETMPEPCSAASGVDTH